MKNFNMENARLPPQSIEVEKHVIGGIFMDPDSLDSLNGLLSAQDFYSEKHEIIFRAAQNLWQARSHPDIIAVAEELRRSGKLAQAGGEGYLMEIGQNVVSSANIRQHAEIIKDKSTMRAVIRMATSILEDAYADGEAPKAVIKRAEESIYRMGEAARGAVEGLLDMPSCVERTARKLEDMANGKPNRVRLGISAIDDIMRGLRFGSLNLLAARPGIGKSALALQAAVECREPVALFSLEMMIEEEIERLMAHQNPSLNADGISTQALVLAKQEAIKAALAKLSQYPIEICDSSKINPAFILSECRRMKRRHGKLGMIVIDYLQMVKSMSSRGSRESEVGGISGDLKQIGNELVCPVLAVASLSRKCEERDNKRPIDADLRDSGQLESDAHGIIFLYRHSKYNERAKKDDRIKNITEVQIAKNRGGPTGKTLLNFKGAMSWFFQVEKTEQEYYQNFLSGADLQDGGGDTPAKGATKKSYGPSRKSKGVSEPSDNWSEKGEVLF